MKRKIVSAFISTFIHLSVLIVLYIYINFFDGLGLPNKQQPGTFDANNQTEELIDVQPLLNEVASNEIVSSNNPNEMALNEEIEQKPAIVETPTEEVISHPVVDSLLKPIANLDSLKKDTVIHTKKQTDPKKLLDSIRLAQELENLSKQMFFNENRKAIRNFKKIYPYALKAKKIMQNVAQKMDSLKTDEERKQFLKQTEKELLATFRKDIESMSFSQGQLLLKLIDRETERNAYSIIKEYRGSTSAVFWQGVARVFGSNLKMEYNAEGADSTIEKIIYLYENGKLE